MRHLNPTALAIGHVVTEWPRRRLTVVAKGRYALAPDGLVTPAAEPAQLAGDERIDGAEPRLRYASDLVPFKPRADVALVGEPTPLSPQASLAVGAHRFVPQNLAVASPFALLAHEAPSRFDKLGTYDAAWLEEQWPWFPRDFDSGYFNAAMPAMQVDYLAGDEAVVLSHLLPGQKKLTTQLPRRRVRCFLDERAEPGPRFREIRLELDTLWIDAETETLCLVWRGICDIEDEGRIEHFVWADESMDAVAKPLVDYEAPLRIAHAPPELPPADMAPPANDNEPAEAPEREQKLLEQLHDRLEQMGMPAEVLLLVQEAERMSDAMAALKKQVSDDPAEAEAVIAEAESKLNAKLEELGHPAEASASVPTPVPDEAPWSRERVVIAYEAGESMASADLSGIDLSGLDLSGADMREALLHGADLTGTTLYDATLEMADLSNAQLDGVVLGLARLAGANLSGVRGAKADFKRAELGDACFDGAALTGAIFDGAQANGASFVEADLTEATFRVCQLERSRLLRAIVHGARFDEARMVDATLRGARGDEVSFRQADLSRLRAGDGAQLPRAQLEGAQADGSLWMGSDLQGADFGGVTLQRADLSRTNLTAANLRGCNCANADLTESDLTEGQLAGANFAGARLTAAVLDRADAAGANFYEAELWRTSRRGFRCAGAHLAMSKLAQETPG